MYSEAKQGTLVCQRGHPRKMNLQKIKSLKLSGLKVRLGWELGRILTERGSTRCCCPSHRRGSGPSISTSSSRHCGVLPPRVTGALALLAHQMDVTEKGEDGDDFPQPCLHLRGILWPGRVTVMVNFYCLEGYILLVCCILTVISLDHIFQNIHNLCCTFWSRWRSVEMETSFL